ncbi:hypothetical protein I4641_15670 [Waterburya agarophytonicola K14]|uniref:Uncharacterized protein n=1 Tax=Waterburya agarophytonicola KI4 TaxID=2874699 RepID=A0A964BT92_9CYAN|nr:hypothetical protein [Waterburya agarophytonicola]MCC0178416.1 hypothetical protein [Waterburya agarophytonicola KI4]
MLAEHSMLRDASQKQVIQKFSFIESLNLSQKLKSGDRVPQDINVNQAFNFLPPSSLKSSGSTPREATKATLSQEDAAIIAAVKTANLAHNSDLPHSDNSYPGIAEIIKYSDLNYRSQEYHPKNPNYLGKILFAIAVSYCLFVLWWLFGHQGSKFITRMMGGKHITLSQSDVEFIDRLERSLDTIDRQLEAQKSSSEEEDKVVYIPVYTPSNNTPTISAPATIPQTQSSATFQEKLSPSPEALKIPAPPPLPAPTPTPSAETSTPQESAKIAAIASKPTVKHTLIGILELGGGKSAALIKVNGQTRRFWLGEEISSSGWTLESITNQTAKINYQGEVRSIAVGETF